MNLTEDVEKKYVVKVLGEGVLRLVTEKRDGSRVLYLITEGQTLRIV